MEKPQASPATPKTSHCGTLVVMGQGDNARCGEEYWGSIYQCDKCKIKDLQALVMALKSKDSMPAKLYARPAWKP